MVVNSKKIIGPRASFCPSRETNWMGLLQTDKRPE